MICFFGVVEGATGRKGREKRVFTRDRMGIKASGYDSLGISLVSRSIPTYFSVVAICVILSHYASR